MGIITEYTMTLYDDKGNPITNESKRASGKIKVIFGRFNKLLVGFGILLATIVGVITNLDKIKERFWPDEIHPISISYMRLFGAFQGPFILDNFDHKGPFEEEIEFGINQLTQSAPPYNDLVNFFNNDWEYKNSRLIDSRPWSEIKKAHSSVYVPDYLLQLGSTDCEPCQQYYGFKPDNEKSRIYSLPADQFDYSGMTQEEIHQFRHLAFPGEFSTKEVLSALKESSKKVGFLCLILENSSDAEISDVKLNYKELKKQDIFSNLVPQDLAKKEIKNEGIQQKIYSTLKTKESFFILLSCYVSNKKGFPSEFITSLNQVITIDYTQNGIQRTMKIREQYREKAIIKNIPFGWYNQ